MRKSPRLGLVSSGSFPAAPLLGAPELLAALGPVLATTFRIGNRLVNSLAAGRAVRGYKEFGDCDLILISAPPARLAGIVHEFCAAAKHWNGKSFVLYQCGRDSRALEPLAGRHATGSMDCLEYFEPPRYVLEGDSRAVRECRNLLPRSGVIEIRAGKHLLFTAGESLASTTLIPLLEAAAACLWLSGVDRRTAMEILDALVRLNLRAYLRAGRKAWKRPAGVWQEQFQALSHSNPRLAAFFQGSFDNASKLLEGDSK